jgi:hypothetical protein
MFRGSEADGREQGGNKTPDSNVTHEGSYGMTPPVMISLRLNSIDYDPGRDLVPLFCGATA